MKKPQADRPLTHEERVELIRTPIIFNEYGRSLPTAGNRCYVNLDGSWLRDDGVEERENEREAV